MDVGELLDAVNAGLGGRWQAERRLAGGWNEGACLLRRPGGSRAVLKWRAGEPERLLGARERVELARARGWPAPAWLATGRAPGDVAWVVQEFIDGRPSLRLDDCVAEQMTGILALQAGLFPGAAGGWAVGGRGGVRGLGRPAGPGQVRHSRGAADRRSRRRHRRGLPAGAGEMVTAASWPIRAGMTVTDLAGALAPYLTVSEGLRLAAQAFSRDESRLSCCAA